MSYDDEGNYDAPARVARGVALLDRKAKEGKLPRFWRTLVSVDTLDLNSEDECVLGQVFGWFSEGQIRLALEGGAADYGFDFHDGGFEEGHALHRAWIGALSGSAV